MRKVYFGFAFAMSLMIIIIAFQNLFIDDTYIMIFFSAFSGSIFFPIIFLFLLGAIAGGCVVLGINAGKEEEDGDELQL